MLLGWDGFVVGLQEDLVGVEPIYGILPRMSHVPDDFVSLLPKRADHAERTGPTHYLWVFDPESGRVHLEHNADRHPKDAVDHSHLAARVPHPDRVHGYAYPIHGGYRITDWDHNEVKDPYIKEQVRRALRGQQPEEHVGSAVQSRALS